MNETLSDLKGKAKHLLAGFLFVSFVIGGCGAAFSLFAAAISSLQNVDTRYVEPVVVASPRAGSAGTAGLAGSAGTAGLAGPKGAAQLPGSTTRYPALPTQTDGALTQPDEPLSHMHSPIGDAMDNGGVYVGTRIQAAFGNMLKGVITTLFLEQNDGTVQGGATYGRTSG
jgi:hypothetical protein